MKSTLFWKLSIKAQPLLAVPEICLSNKSKFRQKKSIKCTWTPCATCLCRCGKTETQNWPWTCLGQRNKMYIPLTKNTKKIVSRLRLTLNSNPLCKNTSRLNSLSVVEVRLIGEAKWQQIATCKKMDPKGKTNRSTHRRSRMKSSTSLSKECSFWQIKATTTKM